MNKNVLEARKHVNEVRASTPRNRRAQADFQKPEIIQSDDYNCTTFSRGGDSQISAPQEIESRLEDG